MSETLAQESGLLNVRPRGVVRVWVMLFLAFLLVGLVSAAILVSRSDNRTLHDIFWLIVIALAMLGFLGGFFWAAGMLRYGVPGSSTLSDMVLGSAETPLVVTNRKGLIMLSNRAYQDIAGVGADGRVVVPTSAFIGLEAADAIFRLAIAARDGNPWLEEIYLPGQSGGDDRWMRVKVSELVDNGREGDLTLWSFHDITAEKNDRDTAYSDIQQAVGLLDIAPVGVFILQDGVVHFMNTTLCDWLGLDHAEKGHNLKSLLSAEGYALVQAFSKQKETNSLETQHFSLDFVKHNGVRLPVRLTLQQSFTEEGKVDFIRALVINHEIQGGQSDFLSEGAASLESLYARLFHASPFAQVSIGTEGRLRQKNALFNDLFREDNPVHLLDICKEGDHEALKDRLEKVINRQARIEALDVELATKGFRSARLYFVSVDSVGNDDIGMVYLLETTEQRNLERQFTQSQKMQAVGQLAGGIAHDFNNVLTAIIGFSELLLETHDADDPAFQDILNIKQNANRAAGLVRQLLAFSRRQTLRPKVIHIEEVLGDLSSMLKRLLGEGVVLNVEFDTLIWDIKADVGQLEQVIINLAVNARDAMAGEGTLTINVRNMEKSEADNLVGQYRGMVANDYLLIEVRDTGEGMTAEVREKMFEPFFSTKEIGKGTGLGLSTVYGIIKQSEGFIYADSEPGQGTCFRLFLPRYEAVAEQDEGSTDLSLSPRRNLTGSETILLVEDEDGVRTISERTLAGRGYKVISACSGQEALELLEDYDQPIDLIISDVVMPELNGPQMVTEIRKTMPDVKVIFVSGYAEESVRNDIGEDSSIAFLPKPFNLKQLISAAKDALESR